MKTSAHIIALVCVAMGGGQIAPAAEMVMGTGHKTFPRSQGTEL